MLTLNAKKQLLNVKREGNDPPFSGGQADELHRIRKKEMPEWVNVEPWLLTNEQNFICGRKVPEVCIFNYLKTFFVYKLKNVG